VWRNDKVKLRALSAPVVIDDAIAIADFQGYVHFLDKHTGALVARVRASKKRVSSAPAASGNTVVVLTDGGTLAAFRVTPRVAAPAPAAAEAAPTPAPPANAAPVPADPVPAPAEPVPAPADPVPAATQPPPPSQ
jgi:hypothetical protein